MLSKLYLKPDLAAGCLDEQGMAEHIAVRDAVLNALSGCMRDLS